LIIFCVHKMSSLNSDLVWDNEDDSDHERDDSDYEEDSDHGQDGYIRDDDKHLATTIVLELLQRQAEIAIRQEKRSG
jgi:hypothetical protein